MECIYHSILFLSIYFVTSVPLHTLPPLKIEQTGPGAASGMSEGSFFFLWQWVTALLVAAGFRSLYPVFGKSG